MAVVIGIGNAGPSKTTTVRRQMRTRRERTSEAWMRGCEIIPMAARKKPHCRRQVQLPQTILREHGRKQLLFKALENLFHARPNKPREHNGVLAESQVSKYRKGVKR